MPKTLLCCLVMVVLATPVPSIAQTAAPASRDAARAATRDQNLIAYVELLRSDIRSQRVAIITELMEFNEADDAAFWPIYREYESELAKLNDERLVGIQEYADAYPNVSDTLADSLTTRALDIESRRTALKSKYYARLKAVLSPRTAARFLQIENQLLMIIDLQIAASLPIVQ